MSEPRASRGSIILIDHEPGVLLALRLVLQTLSFDIQPYSDPTAALEAIKSGANADLVVCDLRMPKLDGLTVIRMLRASGNKIPFLLISAHASSSEREEALARGANGFLTKPFTPPDFVKKFDELTGETSHFVGGHRTESCMDLRK